MTPELHRLLLSVDDANCCEAPQGDDVGLPLTASRIRALQETLGDELSQKFELDDQIQDASFCADLFIAERNPTNPNYSRSLITIRLSNFGNLATVTTAMDRIPPAYDVPRITAILQRYGWIVVDAEALSAVYDGPNQILRDAKISWWIRYFDWL